MEKAVEGVEVASNPTGSSMKIMIEPVPGRGAIASAAEAE